MEEEAEEDLGDEEEARYSVPCGNSPLFDHSSFSVVWNDGFARLSYNLRDFWWICCLICESIFSSVGSLICLMARLIEEALN